MVRMVASGALPRANRRDAVLCDPKEGVCGKLKRALLFERCDGHPHRSKRRKHDTTGCNAGFDCGKLWI